GFDLYATEGQAAYLEERNVPVQTVAKIGSEHQNVLSVVKQEKVQFDINTLSSAKQPRSYGFMIRREAEEHGIISLTNLDTATAILNVIDSTTLRAAAIENKGVKRT